jgi:hypothetical protein
MSMQEYAAPPAATYALPTRANFTHIFNKSQMICRALWALMYMAAQPLWHKMQPAVSICKAPTRMRNTTT